MSKIHYMLSTYANNDMESNILYIINPVARGPTGTSSTFSQPKPSCPPLGLRERNPGIRRRVSVR